MGSPGSDTIIEKRPSKRLERWQGRQRGFTWNLGVHEKQFHLLFTSRSHSIDVFEIRAS
jgi:hypothetical protein